MLYGVTEDVTNPSFKGTLLPGLASFTLLCTFLQGKFLWTGLLHPLVGGCFNFFFLVFLSLFPRVV